MRKSIHLLSIPVVACCLSCTSGKVLPPEPILPVPEPKQVEWQAEIGTLPLGMYARIRSTGPIHLADLPCHLKKRILDLSLNGFLRAGLFLPSFIARPVIGHDHCIVCHIYSFPEPHAPLYSLYTEKASEKRKSDSKPMNNFEKTSKSPLKPLLPLTRRTRLHSRSKTG